METFAVIVLIAGAAMGSGILIGVAGVCFYFFDQG